MNLLNKVILFIVSFLIIEAASSQVEATSFLALYKPHSKHNRIIFPIGYEYTFDVQAGNAKKEIKGILLAAKDSLICLSTDTINVNQVNKITTPFYRHGILFFKHLLGKGGIALVVIGPFNNLINKEKPYIGTLGFTGASLIITSQILRLFEQKTYKVKNHHSLKTVYFY